MFCDSGLQLDFKASAGVHAFFFLFVVAFVCVLIWDFISVESMV